MDLSANSYSLWTRDKNGKREARKNRLTVFITACFRESGDTYGPLRIHKELKAQLVPCSRAYATRMMRELKLRSVHKRAFRATTDSKHNLPVSPNVLDRNFCPQALNTVYASDITYIPTNKGWLYLAVVLDLCSRKVVGWSMQKHMRTELVSAALRMAIDRRKPAKGVLHHSDQGSQYASKNYQQQLYTAGMISSMSRKGNCWDNAPVESFFASLKKELIYPYKQFITRSLAEQAIFRYIEVWYNRKRRHSTLNYLSPESFEARLSEKSQSKAA